MLSENMRTDKFNKFCLRYDKPVKDLMIYLGRMVVKQMVDAHKSYGDTASCMHQGNLSQQENALDHFLCEL